YTSTAPVTQNTTVEGDTNSSVYVWWSVLRSYMRRGGSPDNSILNADGTEGASRFMKAFACTEGHDPDAGCDYGSNMVIMPELNWDAPAVSGISINYKAYGCKPLRQKDLYPDNIVLFDQTEIATGIDPAYSRQYVTGYGVDNASFS